MSAYSSISTVGYSAMVNGSYECGAEGAGHCLISILSHQIATETTPYILIY